MYLALALLLIPLVEIALFILMGNLIGLWPTLALVILAGVAGAGLIRRQGIGAVEALRSRVAARDDPGARLFDGAAILVAGVLLIIPGFLTDILALMLLTPPIRGAMYRALRSKVTVVTSRPVYRASEGRVIEAEYEVLDRDPPRH
jgi:UPF0716 protein FxsA